MSNILLQIEGICTPADQLIVNIRNGDFRASIVLARVLDLEPHRWKKLLRLMLTGEDPEAAEPIPAFFREAIDQADRAWRDASKAFVNGYRDTSALPRGKKQEARMNKQHLKAEVAKRKALKDKLTKYYDVFRDVYPETYFNF